MPKEAYLVCITGENNNKFYHMKEQSDGTFIADYGRIGVTSKPTPAYPISKWDSTLREKTNKGYVDQTHLYIVPDAPTAKKRKTYSDNMHPDARNVVENLMKFAKKSVEENYTVAVNSVTVNQITEAQSIITELAKQVASFDPDKANKLLLSLYGVIPRRMSKVQHHLLDIKESKSGDLIKILSSEQETLDVMQGQVQTFVATGSDDIEESSDLLTSMGLSFAEISSTEQAKVLDLLGANRSQLKRAIKVENSSTRSKLTNYTASCKNPTQQTLWHGSRNENWWNIVSSGLLIRPSGAVYSGSMFGDGLYFANKAQKSIGYTSLSGSYWAKGSSNVSYLALYDVHVGNQKHIYKHSSDHYSLNKQKITSEGNHSVYAHGGADLRNDEFIVYDPSQCSIAYLIEITT